MFDPGDVEEMIFVIVSEVTFHLSRIHAPVRLGHINRWDTERWEHIACHPLNGDPGAEADGNDDDHNGKRSAQRCLNQVHRLQ